MWRSFLGEVYLPAAEVTPLDGAKMGVPQKGVDEAYGPVALMSGRQVAIMGVAEGFDKLQPDAVAAIDPDDEAGVDAADLL